MNDRRNQLSGHSTLAFAHSFGHSIRYISLASVVQSGAEADSICTEHDEMRIKIQQHITCIEAVEFPARKSVHSK